MPIRALVVTSLLIAIQSVGPSSPLTPAEALIEQRVAERVLPGAVLLVVEDGQVRTLRWHSSV
jgi:hypothetical protein